MLNPVSPTRFYGLKIKQGDDSPLVFPVLDDNDQPVDCTGWTARAAAATRKGVVLYAWSTTAGNAVCGPAGVTLLLDESETWDWTYAHFDVVAIEPDETQHVPAEGVIEVDKLWAR